MEFEDNVQLDCGEIILSKIITSNNILLLYNITADNSINTTMFSNLKQISILFCLNMKVTLTIETCAHTMTRAVRAAREWTAR